MTSRAIVLVLLVGSFLGLTAWGDETTGPKVTVETAPPVIVKTFPESGAVNVDPKVTEIKVTFSKDMRDGFWSWTMLAPETFPTVQGKPRYLEDKRTCVLPVKLEPGKTYALWINSDKLMNFKDPEGRSAVPYLLVFRTKKE